jgi:UDP-glucose 4-epimerase
MIKKILITGSLGQLGSYICENFLDDDINIIGLDNGTNKCSSVPERVENITTMGDIRDGKNVYEILEGIDAIIHCAAQISVEKSIIDPKNDADNNIIGTLNLLQASVKTKSVKRFVYISTAATYGNPIKLPIIETHPQIPLSGYGLSKLTAERYVSMFWRIHKLPIVVIRPFNIYSKRADLKSQYSGVITKFIDSIKENKPPKIEGDGNQTRDFIHVKDVVKMIHLVLDKDEAVGEVFNCGNGKPISINQLAEIVTNISRKNFTPIYVVKRKGDIKHSYADISKANKLLNFQPRVDLEHGLKEIINSI